MGLVTKTTALNSQHYKKLQKYKDSEFTGEFPEKHCTKAERSLGGQLEPGSLSPALGWAPVFSMSPALGLARDKGPLPDPRLWLSHFQRILYNLKWFFPEEGCCDDMGDLTIPRNHYRSNLELVFCL